MRRFLQRFPSLLARNFLHSPSNLRHSNTNPSVIVPLFDRAIPTFVYFSSESDSARGVKSDDVVSKEELKKRIQSFLEDEDEDSLPDLFETMMMRKLSGKHDDSDNEVMEEVRKYPLNNAPKVDETDSDIDSDDDHGESSDSDIEFDGLKDVGFSDGLKANHSSYSDSESD